MVERSALKKVQAIGKGITRLTKVLDAISMTLLFVLMALGFVDVIGRYVFDKPIIGSLEIGEILLGTMVFLSWARTQELGGHIKIDILTSRLSPKIRTILEVFTSFIALGIFCLITWQSTVTAISSRQLGRQYDLLAVPMFPFQLIVPVGGFVMCLVLIMQIILFMQSFKR